MTCIVCGRAVCLTNGKTCSHCQRKLFQEEARNGVDEFLLYRLEDESGVSGEGAVAVGVIFPSGLAILEWLNDQNSDVETTTNGLAMYPGGIEDVREVHGHGGKTEVIFRT